jgi:uncharacterized protein DUF4398
MPNSRILAVLVLVAAAAQGCVFVPKTNLRLEEARSTNRVAVADARIGELAPSELRHASETLEQAIAAWSTLDDPAVVDHLAYLAKQRLAIAHEATKRLQAEAALAAVRSEHNLLLTSAGAQIARTRRSDAVASAR